MLSSEQTLLWYLLRRCWGIGSIDCTRCSCANDNLFPAVMCCSVEAVDRCMRLGPALSDIQPVFAATLS